MRLFIAINLNDEMKESLIGIQHTMRAYGMRGNATVPENMHLTLAFIGDYDDPDYVKSVITADVKDVTRDEMAIINDNAAPKAEKPAKKAPAKKTAAKKAVKDEAAEEEAPKAEKPARKRTAKAKKEE